MEQNPTQRCELCGMLAIGSHTDEHGVTHYYCEHHLGSRAAHAKPHDKHAGHSPEMFRTRFLVSLILTIPIVLFSPVVQELLGFTPPEFIGSGLIGPILGSIVFFYGGLVFLRGALNELHARLPGMMTLISLAILSAYAYSLATVFLLGGEEFFWELASLITVMLFGHWMEMRSVQAAQGGLSELAKLLPDTAEVIRGTARQTLPVSQLKVGDLVFVRPGSKIPADGQVSEGSSQVNQAMVTGESKPVEKRKDDEVIAGTVNGGGALTVKVTKIGESTALAGIMRLIAQAQASRSRTQVLADRAAYYLTLIAIGAGAVTFATWLTGGQGTGFALERTVGVLVIACPHALGLAIPLVTAISTGLGASSGLLVRDRMALETARLVDTILFDKTGTLTKGEQTVADLWTVPPYDQKKVLGLAASVEASSEHAIGKAIVATARQQKIPLSKTTDFKALAGRGATARIGKKTITVGGPHLITEQKIKMPEMLSAALKKAGKQGKSIIYLLDGNTVAGALSIADAVRPESKQAVEALQKMGLKVAMITGDAEEVAKTVADELGISQYFAQVLPKHKIDKVKELQKQGKKVAMIGDGVNDAPALTQADVGIAIGAGTDVAIESAGIILVKDDPRDVVKILRLSRATYGKMVQNLIWATGYNVFAIPLAAGILNPYGINLPPAIGALAMSVSTVIVAFNAQLLRRLNLS